MSDQPTTTQPEEYDGQEPIEGMPTPPAAEVDVRLSQAEIDQLLAPAAVSMRDWLAGILSNEEFPEADPEQMALGMLAQILMAKTSQEALSAFDLDRAKEMCGGEPGGRSAVLEIQGARPLKSDYAEGAACYVIVQCVELATGERKQFTTGSRAVQTVIFKHIYEGWMPFRAMLEIRKERTKAGFYPINLVAVI